HSSGVVLCESNKSLISIDPHSTKIDLSLTEGERCSSVSSYDDANNENYVDRLDTLRGCPDLPGYQKIVLDTLYNYAHTATHPNDHIRARWVQVLNKFSFGSGKYVFEMCHALWCSGLDRLLKGIGTMLRGTLELLEELWDKQHTFVRGIFGMDEMDDGTWGSFLKNIPGYVVLLAVAIANAVILIYTLTFANAIRNTLGAFIVRVGSCDDQEAWQLDIFKYVALSWTTKMAAFVATDGVDGWSVGLAGLGVLFHSLANTLSFGTLIWHVSTAPRWIPPIIKQSWVAMALHLFLDWVLFYYISNKGESSADLFVFHSLFMFIIHASIVTLFSSMYALTRVGRDWKRILGGKCLSPMSGRMLLLLGHGKALPIGDLVDEQEVSLLVEHQWQLTHAQLLVMLVALVFTLWFALRQLASMDHNMATSVHFTAPEQAYVIVRKRIQHFLFRRYGSSGMRTFNHKPVLGLLVAINQDGFSTIDYRDLAERKYAALSHRGNIFKNQELKYRGAAYHATAYAQMQKDVVGLWIDKYCMSSGGNSCVITIRELRFYYERASFVGIAMARLTDDLTRRLGDMVTDPILYILTPKTWHCEYSEAQLLAFSEYFINSDVMRSAWCAQEIFSAKKLAIFTECGRVIEWPAVMAGLKYINTASVYSGTAAAQIVELHLHPRPLHKDWWPLHDLLIACKDSGEADRLDILASFASDNLEYTCERTAENVRLWLCCTLVEKSPEIMLLQGYNSPAPGERWFGRLCDPESRSVAMPLAEMTENDIEVRFVERGRGIKVYCRYMTMPTFSTKATKEGNVLELTRVGDQWSVGWLNAQRVANNRSLCLLLVGTSDSYLYFVVKETHSPKRVGGCVIEKEYRGSGMFDTSKWGKSEFIIE
ncbi:hypothetical protein BGX26_011493, partial [Mortierella sp. AD094]